MTKRKTKIVGRSLLVAVIAAVMGSSYLGWSWLDALVCTRVDTAGHHYAAAEEILAVARVDTGGRLLDIDPSLIEDRVERHPWVLEAQVRRLPQGTVSIQVEERTPVALATGVDGNMSAYMDAEGYAMPAVSEAVFDVPLLHGAPLPPNPTQPVASPSVVELLDALATVDERTNALISSFSVDTSGDITMHTVPAAGRSAVIVRLGRRDFAEKFDRLLAFWDQAVLSRPELTFDLIDLRFDSQIVTRES